jgi:ABC-type antimicrobial peptide transport system permease subunit
MSETFFPFRDLARRKFQTGIVIVSITLCVAATLFLLLFSSEVGLGISSVVEGRLSAGFAAIFSHFVLFIGILIFIVGVVIVSFMSFLMMSERTKDIGLMKAAGCPNERILYYFRTELLIVMFLGCFSGIVLGILADFIFINFFSGSGIQFSQMAINLWFVFLIFLAFFFIGITFGGKPISDATKIEPAKAISSTYHYGLSDAPRFRTISKSGFAMKIALRNLYRHKSATIRIVLCLTIVFILVTVAVAGGIIADQTTKNWVEKATGKDFILVAHQETISQYSLLLSKFYESQVTPQFNYTAEKYLLPQELLTQLESMPGVSIDPRLIMETQVREIPGYTIDPLTGDSVPLGSNREDVSLIVGVDPQKVLTEWFLNGEFLKTGQEWKAVVGDTVGQAIFDSPLDESILLFNERFDIVGVSVDPLNNGNVTYVPLKNLQVATNVTEPNIILVKIDSSMNRTETLNQIRAAVEATNPQFTVTELDDVLNKSLNFIGDLWSTIMFLPVFSLIAAAICLVGYVMLSINEQRQELGILRAIGAKPRTVIKIISAQSFIVLFSCYALGIILGIALTLLILVPKPLVTGFAMVEIISSLLVVLVTTFIFTLYPAIKFSKQRILEMMT